jgi:putative ABC transport system permease protein
VTPVVRLSPDYIQWQNNDKYQVAVSPLAGAQPQLTAGTALDDTGTQPHIILPASYVAALGFADNNQAVGQDVVIGIHDATGAMHSIAARATGIEQSALLGGGGAFINQALAATLTDAQGTGAPAATKTAWADAMAIYAPSTADQLKAMKSSVADAGYTAQTLDDRIGTVKTIINGIIGVLDAFAVIALIAAGFGIVNTLLMSVQERTREIGLMKAMGMGSGSADPGRPAPATI